MRKLLVRVIVPPEGSSSPIRMRKSVVLLMPLGPTMASRAPLATENVTPENKSSHAEGFGEGGDRDERHDEIPIAARIIKQVRARFRKSLITFSA